MNLLALNFVNEEKHQQGPILHKQLQHPMKSIHTFNIYTRIITEHSRVSSCLVRRIISTLILLHIFSIISAPKLGSHEIPDRISHGGCKSQIFQHAQKASGSTQCGNSKSLSTPMQLNLCFCSCLNQRTKWSADCIQNFMIILNSSPSSFH